jgi:hypothetical protein
MNITTKAFLGVAGAAFIMTSALPLSAANIRSRAAPQELDDMVTSQVHDGHRRHYHYRHRHHDRVDGGDILAGIGILAGIAIIADAASKSDGPTRRRDARPTYRNSAPARDDFEPRGNYGTDLGSAVTACTDAAERSAGDNARVQEIRSVTRKGQGWHVEGELDRGNNRSFSCSTSDGRVDEVRLDDGSI